MEQVTGPLAAILADHRAAFNARIAQTRLRRPGLAGDEIAGAITGRLRRAVEAIHARMPTQAPRAAAVLLDVLLDQLAAGRVGAGAPPACARAWDELLPALSPLLGSEPQATAATVFNGINSIARHSGRAADTWVRALAAVAPACARLDALRDAGLVLAWRCGMAQFRQAAVARLSALPESVRNAALGLDATGAPSVPELLERLRNPWWVPGTVPAPNPRPALCARAGSFRGFGGPFVHPPRVCVHDGMLLAFDEACCWSLHADCFGAVFERFADTPPAGAGGGSGEIRLATPDGDYCAGMHSAAIPMLRDPSSSACIGPTLAVTLGHSHHVYLVGLA